MYRFGLKLWTINDEYMESAVRYYKQRLYDYIELYLVPGSYERHNKTWKNLNIPYILHAPHYMHGMNLSLRDNFQNNIDLTKEVKLWADLLHADKIIYHPGINGDIRETAHQLKEINDRRILIENKPYYTIDRKMVCNGHSPGEIAYLMNEAKVGFCLDIGHAICSANAQNIESANMIKEFVSLNPTMFHLSDGDYFGVSDSHLNFGKGNYELGKILKNVPEKSMITIETNHDDPKLEAFYHDIVMLTLLRNGDENIKGVHK